MRAFILALMLFGLVGRANAQTFTLDHGNVVGEVKTTVVKPGGDSLAQIARDLDMGYVEMEEANPGIDDPEHLVPGTVLVVPSQFILPSMVRRGIVVNLAEMRLYYYNGNNQVVTYPMGIGREGEDTPLGELHIIQHIPNPTWHVPESIRQMRAAQGINLPKLVPPGPDNPLGEYAMRLSNPNYLIHGTNDPLGGIGRRSSSGCLRMYPEDIKSFYGMVSNGTPVYVINEPYKAGWSAQGELYLESHLPLEDKLGRQAAQNAARIRQVLQAAMKGQESQVDWDKVIEIAEETQGFPQVIGEIG